MTCRLQETPFQTGVRKDLGCKNKNEVFIEFGIKSQISVISQKRSALMEFLPAFNIAHLS